ncbi:hypothetical protein FisN_1Hu446 [Fistulifera solaris]|uniref:Uncharacterized protein n=1 Tax=Fistulifera solaris TaxID=1519565 RepID=A0A1Z5JK73_FISSO|nr:hypothetical protein FisN_1Hu446 [Fistulifera solaris]|eukprot:GAX14252.1 hypothetical protein FisN_1Hu446 [Fistulifera solaris]
MGGDDLGEDPWLQDVVADSDDSEEEDATVEVKKRKNEDISEEQPTGKRRKSPEQLIAEAGRGIEEQSAEEQATLITTVVKHNSISSLENPIAVDNISFAGGSFVKAPNEGCYADRLRPLLSMKKLRRWNHSQSPCVVIVCLSARRAVEILKELTSLKCRIAKLFPKNGSVEQQAKELQSFQFPIVIGTPHRLAALSGCNGYGSYQSLKFNKTMLLVIDSYVSNKMYSVISLPDTAPDCASLLRDAVHPQLKQRQDLKIAFI